MKIIEDEKYLKFKQKFKHKLTTDDCYTPQNVYKVIKDYVISYYKLENICVERPFYPGGDYISYPYKDNSVVIDNPPFSKLSEIKKFYTKKGINFFLFAPSLGMVSPYDNDLCYVVTKVDIIYENGAKISTSFVTNLDEYRIRTDPYLYSEIKRVQGKKNTKEIPTYIYPKNVISIPQLGKFVRAGYEIKIKDRELCYARQLDQQLSLKKAIYGNGFLVSDKVADELQKIKAEIEPGVVEWTLSDREKEIIKNLK